MKTSRLGEGTEILRSGKGYPSYRNLGYLVVSHRTPIHGPSDNLVTFLSTAANRVCYLTLPLVDATDSSYDRCRVEVFQRQKPTESREYDGRPFRGSWANYLYHLLIAALLPASNVKSFDIAIAADPVNCLSCLVLKLFSRMRLAVVYYVIDYSPARFPNRMMNAAYRVADRICAKFSDSTWCISERVLGKLQGYSRLPRVVPIGIPRSEFAHNQKTPFRRRLIIMGNITKTLGIDLALDAFDELGDEIDGLEMEIIGVGPYLDVLREKVASMRLSDRVRFLGRLDHTDLFHHLREGGVGLATYLPDLRSHSYFADPMKPKEYMACGLPVIITRVPAIAEQIEKAGAGFAINYEKRDLAYAIRQLLTDPAEYSNRQRNAVSFSKAFISEDIYEDALDSVLASRYVHR